LRARSNPARYNYYWIAPLTWLAAAGCCAPAGANVKVDQDKSNPIPKTHIQAKPIYSSKDPVLLTASQMDYDRTNDTVVATGNVEVVQGETVVIADTLIYDRIHNQVQAMGNVSMLEPSGNVYFADTLELSDDMKSGLIHQFKARLPDDSLFAAANAHKIDDNTTELYKTAYTPCKCDQDKKTPLWAINAEHATIDQEAQEIRYDNATFNLGGIPIIYTPYFSHPTPGADNQSGLLPPSFLQSKNLGTVYKQPIYYTIAPDKDVTLTPIYTSLEGPVLYGEYRQKFNSGTLKLDGSITHPDDPDVSQGGNIRGHYNAIGEFKINDTYDWGVDIHRASDDTYLHLYNFNNDTRLTSRVYAEGFNFTPTSTRNYASIEALSFQGLTGQDNPNVIPIVAPLMNATWQSEPGLYDSRVSLDANSMLLYRKSGDESRRLSGTASWQLPYITQDGEILELNTQMRTDVYDVTNVQLSNGRNYTGTTGRAIPEASATWRDPFIKRMGESSLTLEPIVHGTISPGGGNPDKIPNEDSLLPDFTDSNLFSSDRFAGYDRVENGGRVSYGMRAQAQVFNDKFIDGLLGQQYRVVNDPNFPISNDPTSHFSDYVGKVGVTYDPINLAYRFRLDKDNLTANRSEIDLGYNRYPFTLNTSYLSLKDDPVLSNREVITGSGAINLTREWSLTGNGSRDLQLGKPVTTYGGVAYKNECVNVTSMLGKDYTHLLDIKPSLTFWFRVTLKNLD
jgi:LPS-assembly protein